MTERERSRPTGRGREDRDERERSSNGRGRSSGLQSRSERGQRVQWRPTSDSVNKQADRSRSRFDSPFKGQMFVAKSGDNAVRILPPTWDNPDHYCFCNWQHRYVGPDETHYLCLRKMKNERCPICEAEREARDRGDEERAKKFKPMQRWACYVLAREGEDPNKPLIWDMNGFQDSDIVNLTKDRKTGAVIFVTDEEEGYDLTFRRSGAKERTRYGSWAFDRDPSPLANDANVAEEVMQYIIDNPIDDCLRYFDADYLHNMLYGTAEPQDEDLDQDEPKERGHERGGRSRAASRDDPAEEAPDNDENVGEEAPFDEDGEPEVRQAKRPVAREREPERTERKRSPSSRYND